MNQTITPMPYQFPPCPTSLKQIQHYLKTAAEHDDRDVVVSYWCRVYALETALGIDKKSDEARALLTSLMDWLEKQKEEHKDNEAVMSNIPGQAHIENYALKLFLWADSQDRNGIFNKNVVKAFYSAGMLFDVLNTFGELTDEVIQNRKYAKWKAAYIHNCLKNGETPIPGPMRDPDNPEDNENPEGESSGMGSNYAGTPSGGMGFTMPPLPPDANTGSRNEVPGFNFYSNETNSSDPSNSIPRFVPPSSPVNPPPEMSSGMPSFRASDQPLLPSETSEKHNLNAEQIAKAQKYCKWASSALNYDDVSTAIGNLEKALLLLKTGKDT